jgi:molybdenum cofactor synthesis domain-containing protein
MERDRDVSIHLLPVGRELLTGRVLDTNSQFLAQRLFELGLRVTRACQVDDVAEAIAAELRRSRRDGASVVVTTGGLGPTPDDVTLKGVALATGRELAEDAAVLVRVRDRYAALHAEGRISDPAMTPDRCKMASLPAGSRIVENPVGTAPGVDLAWGRTRVFCLPGVPAEMKAMAEATVLPALAPLARESLARLTLDVGVFDESRLAAAIRRFQPAFPEVHVKPDPKRFGGERRMLVHFEAAGARDAVRDRLEAASVAFLSLLGSGAGREHQGN